VLRSLCFLPTPTIAQTTTERLFSELGYGDLATLSLGPTLHVDGEPAIPMPGRVLTVLPLINHALPERFPMYLFLALAVISALWLASDGARWRPFRYGVVVVGVVLLLPAQLLGAGSSSDLAVPPFFRDGAHASYLAPGENVLVVPAKLGRELLFQAEADMSFLLARGYLGPVRPEGLPGLGFLPSSGRKGAFDASRLRRFLEARQVGVIVVEEPAGAQMLAVIRDVVGTSGTSVGGVTVYQVPSVLPR
jgi:hypothetical protein